MILVSVYDSKADTFTPPHVSQNEQTAKREFSMVVNDSTSSNSNLVAAHPEDFTLFLVGEWFERMPTDDGRFTARLAAYSFKSICNGIDVKVKD